jgi:hypothetical protein
MDYLENHAPLPYRVLYGIIRLLFSRRSRRFRAFPNLDFISSFYTSTGNCFVERDFDLPIQPPEHSKIVCSQW